MGEALRNDHAQLVTAIYAAALDPNRWSEFLAMLSDAAGGVKTHMFGYDPKARISMNLMADGYDPDFVASYDAYYNANNAWAPGFSAFNAGKVVDCQAMCPHRELVRTEFYNDWIRPQEDIAEGGGIMLFKDDARSFMLGGNIRLRDADKLKKPWLQLLQQLLPDLVQAFEIARALDGRRLEDIILAKQQDGALKPAVVILDENLRIVHASAVAQDMLSRGEPIRVQYSGEIAVRGHNNLAQDVFDLWRSGRDAKYGRMISVTQGMRHYRLRLARLDLDDHMNTPIGWMIGSGHRCAILSVVQQSVLDNGVQMLRATYGLTAAEAEVTLALAQGHSTREIALLRQVSPVTVANQIKSSLQKTNSRQRAELVAKVLKSA